MNTAPPLVPILKCDAGGPYLGGSKCASCGQTFAGVRQTCARCGQRGNMHEIRLAETGKIYVSTIVYRSFPGVAVPFIDVIADLDDGVHLKGTLLGVPPDPQTAFFDMPIRVVYREAALPGKPDETYLTYAFAPLEQDDAS